MTAKELTALLGLVCMTALVTGPAYADDWPEWRGKGRSGIWTETGILDTFPENGLTFNGFMPRLMAMLMPGMFKRQTQKWLDQFKVFSESR